jgi:hypothetical protein
MRNGAMRRMVTKFGLTTVAVAVAGLVSLSAQAATVTATLNTITGQSFQYKLDGVNLVTTAGVFDWTRTGGDASDPTGNFKSFCIELDQTISLNKSFTFEMIEVADGPKPGLALGAGPMGQTKADMLGKLWAAYYDLALTSNAYAAAFQVAVWEIVYDDGLDLSDGGFQARYTTAPAFVQTAQGWLDNLGNLTEKAALGVMSSDKHQDQLVMVPLPAAAWAGLSLIGAVALRRKLRRA